MASKTKTAPEQKTDTPSGKRSTKRRASPRDAEPAAEVVKRSTRGAATALVIAKKKIEDVIEAADRITRADNLEPVDLFVALKDLSKATKAAEEKYRQLILDGHVAQTGNEFVAVVSQGKRTTFDRAAAEAALGDLSEFYVGTMTTTVRTKPIEDAE